MTTAIELWGYHTGNCLRAAIALEEAGIQYETRLVNLPGLEHKDARFTELNPIGQVPVLVDKSGPRRLVLPQSNAIIFYAAQQRPGMLVPDTGTHAYYHVLERFFYYLTDVISVNHSGFLLGRHSGSASNSLYDHAIARIGETERFLSEANFVAGNEFSVADIAAFTIIKARERDIDWPTLPKTRAWFERVAARPSVQRGYAAFQR